MDLRLVSPGFKIKLKRGFWKKILKTSQAKCFFLKIEKDYNMLGMIVSISLENIFCL